MSEQFENSIRKKLEEVDIPFDPAAWDDMKKRLDDSDKRRPVFWWWTSGLLLLLLLGGGGWWWYAQQGQSTAVQNVPVENIAGGNNVNTPAITGTDNVTTPLSEKLNKANKPTLSEKTPNTSPTEKTSNTSLSEKITTPNNKTTRPSKEPIQTSTNEVIIIKEPTTTSEGSTPLLPYEIQPIPFNQLKKISIPANVNNSPVINIPTDTTANSYTKKPKKKKTGFDGGITLGPDFNIAPSFTRGKPGFNGGLFLRYHVNNRLSLSVAAIYAKKVYGATPKDYKFSYPTNYVKIDADCNVLDVPLNVNYTFLDRPKSSWSAMAGASSYFMLKEKYDYYWANNNKRTREFSNQNQHYFSVLNLGVTYERKTSGRLKWGLQPYVKVPLNGVGEGKVKLSSAGVSLQLSLGKKD
ncbi:outer membrane beta-barrel protein [Chitinophaga niabensis]|uniref:Outer membrane protein beta-barrel domain-containing protein n=1 Tax=Chitinophaga niabensis TaxID=536979 RepID=A0A1N6JNM4_9BACT|nr:outer membrane beta-barrel protein [Chitinophaga niabensis]SIO45843.1 Outer membrane protein beta-barrel domain-containing protein [Chitinophaga niabensis]